ncbi:hypothetical protein GCM10010468_49520 [Actinocorallia longicatena]|uniref:HNH endonuclease n=1 Tax=Actinocorallia longicatena TaxID=111803 RepID=A0ABP6QDZ8_9ACTN
MAEAWRTTPLPPNWPAIRRAVLARDQHACQIRGPRCTGKATDVDHMGAADDHRPEVLQSACGTCHASKTGREAQAARAPQETRARPRPQGHPGLLAAPSPSVTPRGGEGPP